jgi:hypothetical protein
VVDPSAHGWFDGLAVSNQEHFMLQVSKSPVSIETPSRSWNSPVDRANGSFAMTTIVLAIFCGLGLAAFFAVYAMAPAEMIAHMTPLE